MDQSVIVQKIYSEAERNGVSPAKIAAQIDKRFLGRFDMWPQVKSVVSDDEYFSDINICCSERGDILTEYTKSICKAIQFPENTAFLHGMATVASAMVKSFYFEYNGSQKPVTLYAVTAQPPSTGKSGVNECFSAPIMVAYEEHNKRMAKIRSKAIEEIEGLMNDLKNATNEAEKEELRNQKFKQEEIIKNHPHVLYSVDDATPEALAKMAEKQGGMFNVVSAEADAANVMLGNVYSDRKANYGLILKGWDGEYHSVIRASKETEPFFAKGCIAIIAQDESIDSMLEAGQSGRGISERFLLLRERNMFGDRNHNNTHKVSMTLSARYSTMIHKLVLSDRTVFKFDDESIQFLRGYRQKIEPELADGGKYSNTMLRGALGKADKQIMRIACILHASIEWDNTGNESKLIDISTTMWAVGIYDELIKTYIDAADSMGFAGDNAELIKLEQKVIEMAGKNKMSFSVQWLRDNIKKTKPFSGVSKLTNKLRDDLLPSLESRGYLVTDGDTIYINPHLR